MDAELGFVWVSLLSAYEKRYKFQALSLFYNCFKAEGMLRNIV